MNVLVTGGAGYIGSHATRQLIQSGKQVIVVDNLSRGSIEAIDKRAIFYQVDIRDYKHLDEVFKRHQIEVVMHFASKVDASESVEKPLLYYQHNVFGSHVLLSVMKANGVNKIVFSSSAAVYGHLDKGMDLIVETDPTNPINPYGETKLVVEKMIKWTSLAYKLDYIIFRYFNVAGSKKVGLEPIKQSALIPRVLCAAKGLLDKFIFVNTNRHRVIIDLISFFD